MDIKQLESWLTEGLTDDQAAIVRSAINRDTVKSKAASLKEQSEFATIEAQRQALQFELDGDPAKNMPGSRAYRDWYAKNHAAIQANSNAIEAYDKKYGQGAFSQMISTLDSNPQSHATTTGLSKDDVLRLIQQQFYESQAPDIANVLKTTGRLVQKHMYAKRTNPIDFDALDRMMLDSNKAGRPMTIEQAYDEWDKPEREKVEASNREAEIDKRVKEELQKRGASTQFPSGADMTPSSLSARSKSDLEKFDKNAMHRSLMDAWNNPDGATH
jgi:hypothetical protein